MNTELPCVRGCVWSSIDNEEPRPRGATHGVLCASCFHRLKNALSLVPDLMANMRAQIDGFSAAPLTERVGGGGTEAPAPLRIAPLDASDSLYAKLVLWAKQFAELFGTKPPTLPAWANNREVQGSRPITPDAAFLLAAHLRDWFLDRELQIASSTLAVEFHNDICFGWSDAPGVFSLSSMFGVEAPPAKEAEKRACPICGAREVFVKRPDLFDDSIAVICGRCAHVLPPDEKKYSEYLEQIG